MQVIGIDISPHMKPDETPENLWLQVSVYLKPLKISLSILLAHLFMGMFTFATKIHYGRAGSFEPLCQNAMDSFRISLCALPTFILRDALPC